MFGRLRESRGEEKSSNMSKLSTIFVQDLFSRLLDLLSVQTLEMPDELQLIANA